MVGGCGESVEECDKPMSLSDRLRARWEETKRAKGLQEYGPTGTITSAGATQDPVAAAKELNNASANLNKLKSAGVNLPVGIQQAAKSTIATANNPGAIQGQNMDQTAKKTTTAIGQEIEQLIATGKPSDVQQVANAIKNTNLGQK